MLLLGTMGEPRDDKLCGLTFDMRGDQKAQPFGHPIDGRVRRHGVLRGT
jgi:hypothetical protein